MWDCWSNAPGRDLLLTTARPTPTCGRALPPREKLGRDGVAVWLQTSRASWHHKPELIRDPRPATGAWTSEKRATCTSGPGRNFGARVQDGNLYVLLGAVVCGPGYGRESVRFSGCVSSVQLYEVVRSRGPGPRIACVRLREAGFGSSPARVRALRTRLARRRDPVRGLGRTASRARRSAPSCPLEVVGSRRGGPTVWSSRDHRLPGSTGWRSADSWMERVDVRDG